MLKFCENRKGNEKGHSEIWVEKEIFFCGKRSFRKLSIDSETCFEKEGNMHHWFWGMDAPANNYYNY